MDASKVDRIVQYALAVAARADERFDRELGPIHLLKCVYLADLASAEKHGATFTGASWRFFHYGPWAEDVHARIEPAADAIGADKKTIQSKYDRDFVRWALLDGEEAEELFEDLDRTLPSEVAAAVRRAVRQFGKDTASLLHYVYNTRPMLNAAPNEILVFEKSPPVAPSRPRDDESEPIGKGKRKRILEAFKQEIRAQLAEMKNAQHVKAPAPEYDEAFARGKEWLDSLAGEPAKEGTFEAEFSDDIWKSPSRGEPGVP